MFSKKITLYIGLFILSVFIIFFISIALFSVKDAIVQCNIETKICEKKENTYLHPKTYATVWTFNFDDVKEVTSSVDFERTISDKGLFRMSYKRNILITLNDGTFFALGSTNFSSYDDISRQKKLLENTIKGGTLPFYYHQKNVGLSNLSSLFSLQLEKGQIQLIVFVLFLGILFLFLKQKRPKL